VTTVIADQKIRPLMMTLLRAKRSPMMPASGAAAAYTHMNDAPTMPSCRSVRPISVFSRGKTE
jgi:hypothetical protein